MTTATAHDQLFTFFGLKENPFNVSPDLRFLFATPALVNALAELLLAIRTRQGLTLLTGESGVGKTTFLQCLLDTLRRCGVSSSYIFHAQLDANDLFQFILQDFGVPCESPRKGEVLQTLYHWLIQRYEAGDTPVVIVDEAQALPVETLAELRLLLNVESSGGKLMEIVLAGQPELEEKLRRSELHPLRQRIVFRGHLPQLTLEQTSAYIQSRLTIAGLVEQDVFPKETLAAIYHHSRGIARSINLLGERAMINAYAEKRRSISPEDIHYIALDFSLLETARNFPKKEHPSLNEGLLQFPAPRDEPGPLGALCQALLPEHPYIMKAPTLVDTPANTARMNEETQCPREPLPSATAALDASVSLSSVNKTRPTMANSIGETHFRPASAAAAKSSKSSSVQHGAGGIGPRMPEYWKDIANSFRRDARDFYSQCARFLLGHW